MVTETSEFEASEMAATFLASTPLLRESWRLCAAAPAMGFAAEIRGGVGYLAFSGVQSPEYFTDATWGRLVALETAGAGVFGPLVGRGGDDKPAMVHAGLLRLFMGMLESQAFISQILELKEKCKAIVITGHSLGGAAASLTTLWLLSHLRQCSLLCVTFGAPLLGDAALAGAVLRERWAANFCHVAASHDLMPRLLFAPAASLTPQAQLLLRHWHASIDGTGSASPDFAMALAADVAAAMEAASAAGESLFWPFGNYMLVSKEGAVCVDEAACALRMMHLTLLADCCREAFVEDHLKYGAYVAGVHRQSLQKRKCVARDMLPASSYEAGLALAVQSAGIGHQEPAATLAKDCLTTARRSGLVPILNCAKLAINLSKVVPYRAEIEWYKESCNESAEQMGYYDSFKQRGQSRRGYKVNMNRHKLADFWDSVIEKLEKKQLPHDFPTRDKWVNAFHSYKLLVEPLDIAEYYRNRNERHLNEGHYRSNGRPRRYVISDMWWQERQAGKETNTRTRFASLTQDTCFWARLEEAKEWLVLLQRDAVAEKDKNKIWDFVSEFDAYAKELVERKEVSKDVVAKNSSYTKWTEDLRRLSSATVFPAPPVNFVDGLNFVNDPASER